MCALSAHYIAFLLSIFFLNGDVLFCTVVSVRHRTDYFELLEECKPNEVTSTSSTIFFVWNL